MEEDEKITKYSLLAKEIRKMHWVSMKIMPLVVGCLGVVSGWFEGFFFLRSWDSRCGGRNAGIQSHWDHPNPPRPNLGSRSGVEAKQCLCLHSQYHLRRQCGPVVRALALRSGDPRFKTCSDHSLNLILVVPGSTSQLHL